MRGINKVIIDSLIVILISYFLYIFIDIIFGLITGTKHNLNITLYSKEPYFSEEFLAEIYTGQKGLIAKKGTRLIFPKEHHGKYLNVDVLLPCNIPYRRTLNSINNQIKDMINNKVNILLLLGGSTMYCSEVPDQLTIASILSKELNNINNGGERYYVMNAGVPSANSIQELERLRYELERGLRPDIVVVYNGVNDVFQGVYLRNPEGVMFSYSKINRTKEIIRKIFPLNIVEYIKENAAIHFIDNLSIEKINEFALLADQTKEVYKRNVMEMHRLANKHHFRLIVILQPHLFINGYNEKQTDVIEAKKLTIERFPKLENTYSIGYPRLKNVISEIYEDGVEAYDLSEILIYKKEDIFLDYCHLNGVGNKMIVDSLITILINK